MTEFRSATGWVCRTCGEFVEDDDAGQEKFKSMFCDNCDEEDSEEEDGEHMYLVQNKCLECGTMVLTNDGKNVSSCKEHQ